MTSYRVGVSNHFMLLGDEDGAPVAPSSTKPEPVQTNKAPRAERSTKSRGDKRGARNDRTRQAGGRRGKREFDRHSGTGRGYENKRDGKGRYNWGQQGDAEDGESRRRPHRARRAPKEENGAGAAEEAAGKGADAAADEREAKDGNENAAPGSGKENDEDSDADQQDLTEYLKQLEDLRVDEDANLSIRQAEEDDGQFQHTEALTREAEDSEDDTLMSSIAGGKTRKAHSKSKKGKKKGAMSLDEFTKGQRRRNHGRGGSGSRQFGRGRQYNANANKKQVNIDDKSAFPSLVSAN